MVCVGHVERSRDAEKRSASVSLVCVGHVERSRDAEKWSADLFLVGALPECRLDKFLESLGLLAVWAMMKVLFCVGYVQRPHVERSRDAEKRSAYALRTSFWLAAGSANS